MRHLRYELFNQIEAFINDGYEESGMVPSIYDISDEFHMAPSSVLRYLNAMEERGIIERIGQRDILTEKIRKIQGDIAKIPLLGKIACGEPIFADGNIRDYIHLPNYMLGRGTYYMLTAQGESMIEAGIDDGDLVLIRQQDTAENGQIIVALVDREEATLKRFYPEPRKRIVRLHPENSTMDDIYVDAKELSIQGVAVKVIKVNDLV